MKLQSLTLVAISGLGHLALAGTLHLPRQEANPASSPIWAEVQKDETFESCKKTLRNGDPCIRELFHLQGSSNRFRLNCHTGDLRNGINPVVSVNEQNYPKDKFPQGPQCGIVKSSSVEITENEYKTICNECFPESPQEFGQGVNTTAFEECLKKAGGDSNIDREGCANEARKKIAPSPKPVDPKVGDERICRDAAAKVFQKCREDERTAKKVDFNDCASKAKEAKTGCLNPTTE